MSGIQKNGLYEMNHHIWNLLSSCSVPQTAWKRQTTSTIFMPIHVVPSWFAQSANSKPSIQKSNGIRPCGCGNDVARTFFGKGPFFDFWKQRPKAIKSDSWFWKLKTEQVFKHVALKKCGNSVGKVKLSPWRHSALDGLLVSPLGSGESLHPDAAKWSDRTWHSKMSLQGKDRQV